MEKSQHSRLFTMILLQAGIFLAYILTGKFGLNFALVSASATTVWAPTGIAIAAFLLYGLRVWPAIFLAAFLVNITTQGNIATSLLIAMGNTLEGVVAWYLVNRFANGKNSFDRVLDIVKFVFLAGLVSTLISPTIGVASLTLFHFVSWQQFFYVWLIWWLGDIGGAVLVAPLILLWLENGSVRINLKIAGELALFLALIVCTAQLVFSGLAPYPYIIIPALVIGAFRFGQREEVFALLLLAVVATVNTIHGHGPYVAGNVEVSLVLLEMFLITCAGTIYIVTAALLERKEARKGLESSEKRFRSLIEKSFDAIVLIDGTSRISYASPSIERVLGYKPEELIGKLGFSLIYPEDVAMTQKILSQLLEKQGGTMTIQYRSVRKDKKIIWVEVTGTNLLHDGLINSVVINFHDITESKIAQEQLREEKSEDDAILASIGEGMIATDNKGKITVVNRAACDMLKFIKSQLIGKDLISTVPMQDGEKRTVPREERPMSKVLKEKKLYVTSPNNYYVRSDKSKFPVRFTLAPVMVNNQIIGTVEVFRDITHEIEVDRAKSEFVSLASHQLRTPLTTIDWYIERLMNEKSQKLSATEKEEIKEVYHATKRMVDLVNALLNASRLELGTFIATPKVTSYEDILADILELLKTQIAAKKIKLVKKITPSKISISADPKLLSIIIENLLSNAIKYSKKESTISVSITLDDKGYSFIVSDSGIGIPEADQKKIFTKMFRSDNAKLVDREGTGLGLYITKSIIDETGGKISFTSNKNEGTSFTVWYPKAGMKKKIGTKELR